MVQKKNKVAAVSNHDVFSVRLSDVVTLYIAEAKANQPAFELIKISKDSYFTILSDSLSCLQSIHNMNIDHPFILDILCNYLHASKQSKIVNFFWIPSHIGIHANSKAESAAKSALHFEIVKFRIPYTDLKYFIKLYINSLLQIFWDFSDTSKLYSFHNKVNKPFNFNLKRTDDVIISRIRIGHSELTDSYLLKGKQQPECIFCDCPLTAYIFRVLRHLSRTRLTF